MYAMKICMKKTRRERRLKQMLAELFTKNILIN